MRGRTSVMCTVMHTGYNSQPRRFLFRNETAEEEKEEEEEGLHPPSFCSEREHEAGGVELISRVDPGVRWCRMHRIRGIV